MINNGRICRLINKTIIRSQSKEHLNITTHGKIKMVYNNKQLKAPNFKGTCRMWQD